MIVDALPVQVLIEMKIAAVHFAYFSAGSFDNDPCRLVVVFDLPRERVALLAPAKSKEKSTEAPPSR